VVISEDKATVRINEKPGDFINKTIDSIIGNSKTNHNDERRVSKAK